MSSRLQFIDVTRGLLLVWMILSHSLGRAQIPLDNPLPWLRPHGWATYGFVMLSGFTVAYLFEWSADRQRILRNKLWKRAIQIGCIAYLSNLMYVGAKLWLVGHLTGTMITKIIALQYPWGYSSILIPTMFFLIIAPLFMRLGRGNAARPLFLFTTLLVAVFDFSIRNAPPSWMQEPLYQVLFLRNKYLIFPMGSLFIYAIWAFTFANWLRHSAVLEKSWAYYFLLGGAIYVIALVVLQYDSYNPGFLFVGSRFPLILGIGIIISNTYWLGSLAEALGFLGRSALLVYIFHRPFLQSLDLLFNGQLSMLPIVSLFMILGILVPLSICVIKERKPTFARHLKQVGF